MTGVELLFEMHIKTGPIERHTLSVTVDNESGVLARIAGIDRKSVV